jgi:hypothetical protein
MKHVHLVFDISSKCFDPFASTSTAVLRRQANSLSLDQITLVSRLGFSYESFIFSRIDMIMWVSTTVCLKHYVLMV